MSGAPYAYAANDPANATDPSGMLPSWDDVAGVVSSVVPASISDAAAAVVDVLTGGAASDITCNGLNWGNALTGGANIAMTFVPGGRIGEELAVAAKGGRGGSHLLVEAAEQGGKGEMTGAGHALTKHGGKVAFPVPTGSSAAINAQGSAIVREIVENEFRRVSFYNRRLKFQVTDIYDKTGRGVRYSHDGDFVGFLEPRR